MRAPAPGASGGAVVYVDVKHRLPRAYSFCSSPRNGGLSGPFAIARAGSRSPCTTCRRCFPGFRGIHSDRLPPWSACRPRMRSGSARRRSRRRSRGHHEKCHGNAVPEVRCQVSGTFRRRLGDGLLAIIGVHGQSLSISKPGRNRSITLFFDVRTYAVVLRWRANSTSKPHDACDVLVETLVFG